MEARPDRPRVDRAGRVGPHRTRFRPRGAVAAFDVASCGDSRPRTGHHAPEQPRGRHRASCGVSVPAGPDPTEYPTSWAPGRTARPDGVTAAGADRSARHAVPAVDAYPAGWVDPQQRPAVVAAHGARPATATVVAAEDRPAYAAAVRAAEAERVARESASNAKGYSDGREGLAHGSDRAAAAAAVRDAETERYRREVWDR